MNRATLRINKFSAQGITREKRKSHETSLSSTSVWRGVKCERMFGWRLDNKIHDEVNERHPEGETDKEQKKRLSQGNSIKKNEAWKRREGDNDVRKYIVQETEIILLILSLTKRSSSSKAWNWTSEKETQVKEQTKFLSLSLLSLDFSFLNQNLFFSSPFFFVNPSPVVLF